MFGGSISLQLPVSSAPTARVRLWLKKGCVGLAEERREETPFWFYVTKICKGMGQEGLARNGASEPIILISRASQKLKVRQQSHQNL